MPFAWMKRRAAAAAGFAVEVQTAVRRSAGPDAAIHVVPNAAGGDHIDVAVVLAPETSALEMRTRLDPVARDLWAAHGRDVSFMILVRRSTAGEEAMIAALESATTRGRAGRSRRVPDRDMRQDS